MTNISDDEDIAAWFKYPHYRKWFNKLYVAERFSYSCGPAGIPVPESGEYIVRPIVNLAGMGIGARVMYLEVDEVSEKIPAGYFWCEYFQGRHLSVDFVKENGKWQQLNAYEGFNEKKDLTRFFEWKRVEDKFDLPRQLKELEIDRINFECIKDPKTNKINIFEVHLRNGFDHMMKWRVIVPVFKGDPTRREGFRFLKAKASGYGYLLYPRIGYLVQ